MSRRGMVLPTLLAGTVLFFWGFLSHVVLPWHDGSWNAFADEGSVVAAIEENGSRRGLYFIPFDQRVVDVSRPRVTVNYVPAGTPHSSTARAGVGWVIDILSALLVVLAWRLLGPAGRLQGALFFGWVGLVVGFVSNAYYWNWFGFPTRYALVSLMDSVAAWTLAGAAVNSVTRGLIASPKLGMALSGGAAPWQESARRRSRVPGDDARSEVRESNHW